jgi:hypothetical protein
MSFDPAIDLGSPSVELADGSYVSTGGRVFNPNTIDLGDQTIEFATGSYVASGNAVFFGNNIDLGSPSVEFGVNYTVSPGTLPKVWQQTEIINVYAKLWNVSDDAIEIMVGKTQDQNPFRTSKIMSFF